MVVDACRTRAESALPLLGWAGVCRCARFGPAQLPASVGATASSSSSFTMFRIARFSFSSLTKSTRCRSLATAASQVPAQSYGNLPTSRSPITPKLAFFNSVMEDGKQIPTYRVLDGSGKLIEGAQLPEVSVPVLHFDPMLTGRQLDEALARKMYVLNMRSWCST